MSFLITLAPAGPAPPAMFAPELELLLLFLSLSFLMKEGLKLPIRANEDFLKKKIFLNKRHVFTLITLVLDIQ